MAKDNNIIEAALFKTTDKLRRNIDVAEYKNIVLGLTFLKYIFKSFQKLYERLKQDEFLDHEDRGEYIAENIFFVSKNACWSNLESQVKSSKIGIVIDKTMDAIEKENKELENVFAKPNLEKDSLRQY